MSATLAVVKTLVIPALISLVLYLLLTSLLLPLYARYRSRYSRYVPLSLSFRPSFLTPTQPSRPFSSPATATDSGGIATDQGDPDSDYDLYAMHGMHGTLPLRMQMQNALLDLVLPSSWAASIGRGRGGGEGLSRGGLSRLFHRHSSNGSDDDIDDYDRDDADDDEEEGEEMGDAGVLEGLPSGYGYGYGHGRSHSDSTYTSPYAAAAAAQGLDSRTSIGGSGRRKAREEQRSRLSRDLEVGFRDSSDSEDGDSDEGDVRLWRR